MAEQATRCERRPPVLVYDGECRLCVTTKERLERAGAGANSPNLRFIPYQSDEAKTLLGARYRQGRPDMAFLVEPSGDVREGLEAFLPLAPALPGGRAFLALVRLPFCRAVARWTYRVVARYRYRVFGSVRQPKNHDRP